MAAAKRSVSRRVRIGVVVVASALFMLAIMNLILVSERAPLVDPDLRPPRDWRAGASAGDEGRESWAFVVDTRGRDIVELRVAVPFVVAKTHVRGEADLVTRFSYLVDDAELAAEERTFEARAEGNASEPRSRTVSERGTFGFGGGSLRVDVPEGLERFVLLLTWDWRTVTDPDTDASFRIQVGEVVVEGLDTGGVPFCDALSCARLLVVLGLVVQVAAFVYMGAGAREQTRPPFMKRQSQAERAVQSFEVDEPDALPQPKRRTGRPTRKRL